MRWLERALIGGVTGGIVAWFVLGIPSDAGKKAMAAAFLLVTVVAVFFDVRCRSRREKKDS